MILPVVRSRQMVSSVLPSNAVTKMRFSVNTGEECPAGRGVFHTRFRWESKRSGRFFDGEIPEPLGPRNCVQSAAGSATANRSVPHRTISPVYGLVETSFPPLPHGRGSEIRYCAAFGLEITAGAAGAPHRL